MVEASGQRPDYERSDADPRLILKLAAGIAVYLLAMPGILLLLYPLARHEPPTQPTELPPAPRLQIDPRADLAALRDAAKTRLSSYGWIDRTGGVVHLPIDRAIQLTAERGLSGWTKQ